jgi:hypothetical protein
MWRGALLLWLGFLGAAAIGGGAVWALAKYTTVAGLPAFFFGVCAGIAWLIIYVVVVTKLGM